MSTPKRIQRCRVKGRRKPEGTIVVTRGTRWGNPHDWRVLGHAEAVRRDEVDLVGGRLDVSVEDVRRELVGKDLCCWCAEGMPCRRITESCKRRAPGRGQGRLTTR